MTLACEDANSKLVDAVTVAVDAEESVGDNLVEIWKLMLARRHFVPGHFAPKDKISQDKMPQGHFAPRHFAPNRTKFCKVDILPQL